MTKPRVMLLVNIFPQLSQTYIKNEIEALSRDYEVRVISYRRAPDSYVKHVPYQCITRREEVLEAVQEFRPAVLHGHWMFQAFILSWVSRRTGIPFTVRLHSFDCLPTSWQHHLPRFIIDLVRYPKFGIRPSLPLVVASLWDRERPMQLKQAAPLINDDSCLGVLAMPFAFAPLLASGVREEKVRRCYPVIDYKRFHNRGENGDAIMNVGAAVRKKKMEDFIDLARLLPQRQLNLYAIGYSSPQLERYRRRISSPVKMMPLLQPEDMAAEYKKHQWLVYTGRRGSNIGWPLAVAEAQASGVGVCMANLRPDLAEYLGGAGHLFDTVQEVADIVSRPPTEEQRHKGFEHARRSDIGEHLHTLTSLWPTF